MKITSLARVILLAALPAVTVVVASCRYTTSSHASASSSRTQISAATALWMLKQARREIAIEPSGKTDSAGAKRSTKTVEQPSAAKVVSDAGNPPPEAQRPGGYDVILTFFYPSGCGGPEARRITTGLGEGKTLVTSLAAAISDTRKQPRLCPNPLRIQIDVVSGGYAPLEKPASEDDGTAAELLDPGADGLRIQDSGSVYYLPPSMLIYAGVFGSDPQSQSAADLLTRACSVAGLSPDFWSTPSVTLSSFHTASFVESASGKEALPVVRAATDNVSVDRDHLIASAKSGGDYLVRMQQADGSFIYSYDAATGRPDSRHYNIIRHEGAACSLFELYAVTGDRTYLDAATKAVDYLKTRVKILPASQLSESPFGPTAAYVTSEREGRTQLGANGLGLLAINYEIKYGKKAGDEDLAKKLANMILLMQRKDGSFRTSYYVKGEGPEEPPSLYYPGEAMLALMTIYNMNRDTRLLDSVRRGADYLMRFEKLQGSLPPDAWFAQTLEKLFAVTGERSYAEHAIDLAAAMVDSQYSDSAPEGYAGGIAPGIPRAVQSASRGEGVLAGYRLATKLSDPRASKLMKGLRSAARFEMSQQFGPDNSYFLPDPPRAMGGVRESIVSMRVRIDYVQHTISSLLGLYGVTN